MNGILVMSESDDVSLFVVVDALKPTQLLLFIKFGEMFLPVIPLDIAALQKLLIEVLNG